MPHPVTTDLVERVRPLVAALAAEEAPRLPDLRYADIRLEVIEGKVVAAENGAAKFANDDYGCSVGVRVLAGRRALAAGHAGRLVGAAEVGDLAGLVRDALEHAYRRALASAERKARARDGAGALGRSLADLALAPVAPAHDVVPARFAIDPRGVPLDEMVRFTTDLAREVAAIDPRLQYTSLVTQTELQRLLFCSSEGAVIDQSFAFTQGMLYAVAVADGVSQEVFDVLGHQRGWEILVAGIRGDHLDAPDFRTFAGTLAREAVEVAQAPPLPGTEEEVVVVTDPHYSALVAHEIIGHPAELDRALKMEIAYAGRSWLLRSLEDSELGRPIASPLVTAFSDPTLAGYGHYRYDDEGTPGQRVVHVDAGVFRGFTNSRQTAAIVDAAPNGHYKAADASLVPLIRMSNTAFAPGSRDPRDILGEVDRGWYVVGHRIPSIAESRENFRISARRVYAIERGELGRLYRDGGIMADTRDYLSKVDAVGTDFRLHPIPNCGKGQPMQTKRLGNGGPTMRSRARLTGGR